MNRLRRSKKRVRSLKRQNHEGNALWGGRCVLWMCLCFWHMWIKGGLDLWVILALLVPNYFPSIHLSLKILCGALRFWSRKGCLQGVHNGIHYNLHQKKHTFTAFQILFEPSRHLDILLLQRDIIAQTIAQFVFIVLLFVFKSLHHSLIKIITMDM